MNPPEYSQPILTLLPGQAAEVGRIAACFVAPDEASAAEALAFNVQALQWLESLGCLEREDGEAPRWNLPPPEGLSPQVLRMLGERIEALVEITFEGSPVKLVTAFEQRRGEGERFIFSGRGPTPQSALAGCVFEAIETFAAQWPAVAETYGDREAVEAVSVVTGETVSLPLHRVFLDLPQALCPAGGRPCGSNGLAAGRDEETAALAALLELIERDAVALWWRSRYRAPAFRPASRAGAAAIETIALWLRSKGRRLHLLDLAHDIGLPVVLAVSCDGKGERPLIGAAADLFADDAAYGAASELLQMEANLALVAQNVARQGSAVLPAKTRHLWDWHSTASLESHAFLQPRREPLARPRHSGSFSTPSVAAVAGALATAGVDAAILQLRDPLTDTPVARAVSDSLMDLQVTNLRAERLPEQLGLISAKAAGQPLNEEPVPL